MVLKKVTIFSHTGSMVHSNVTDDKVYFEFNVYTDTKVFWKMNNIFFVKIKIYLGLFRVIGAPTEDMIFMA